MNPQDPVLQDFIDRVQAARADGVPLDIRGSGSKGFYGEPAVGEPFDVRGLSGISSYEPTELVVTARCGTPLAELEAVLAEKGQCLPFEPPQLGPGATVGGMVAAGLSGPSRAAVGSVRDYVLGAALLNGRAEVLSFGGQVMKNVAGYDVSRLLVGSLGLFGVILEVSLKVLPQAPATATLRFEAGQAEAIRRVNHWGGRALPINASAWWDGSLVLRLRGAAAAVDAAIPILGGERVDDVPAHGFWHGLREQQDEYFVGARAALQNGSAWVDTPEPLRLWRLGVPATTPPIDLPGDTLIEWGGAQRWLLSTADPVQVREHCARVGGHATLYLSRRRATEVFSPLSPPLARLHRELKRAFDPQSVFNPGRLYPGL